MRMYMVIKLAIKANMQLCDLAVISGLSPERSNGLNSRMHFHTIKSTYSASLWPTSMVTDSKLATCCRCCSHCLWGRMKMGRAWGLGILQRVQGFPAAKPAACKNILQFCGIACQQVAKLTHAAGLNKPMQRLSVVVAAAKVLTTCTHTVSIKLTSGKVTATVSSDVIMSCESYTALSANDCTFYLH